MICDPCYRGCFSGTCRNQRCECMECGGVASCPRDHTDVEKCGFCDYTAPDVMDSEVNFWRRRQRSALLFAEQCGRTASEWRVMTSEQQADAVKMYLSQRRGSADIAAARRAGL